MTGIDGSAILRFHALNWPQSSRWRDLLCPQLRRRCAYPKSPTPLHRASDYKVNDPMTLKFKVFRKSTLTRSLVTIRFRAYFPDQMRRDCFCVRRIRAKWWRFGDCPLCDSRSGKLLPVSRCSVQITKVAGGKTAREVAEQLTIDRLGGIKNLENIRNPIGPARQYLLP